ncbi:MAG: ABC transporter permease, partial [Dehalococcoidia bacterium]|nr:ABC transporter permease [Dehalococcoidia bacterium]
MKIFSMVQAAVMALTTNKLRTGLTMLGIVIGVGAVIALMAAGQGAKQGVTKEVSGLGSNLIFVTAQRSQSTSSSSSSRTSSSTRSFNPFSLTTDDADALKGNSLLPYVEAVVAQYSLDLESKLTGNGRS